MHGLEIVDLNEANFFERLLKREPKENAFFAINNLLASVPVLELDKDSIDSCLDKHGVSRLEARSRLNNFYSIILNSFLRDWELTREERQGLDHLQKILGLDRREVSSLNSATIYPIYRNYVREKVSDGEFPAEDRQEVEQLATQLGLPKNFAVEIYKKEAHDYLDSVLKVSLADGMLSNGEEQELERIAKNLRVELKFTEDAKKNLDRCRYLWRLYSGDLEEVLVPMKLGRGNKCFGFIDVSLHEITRSRNPVRYSGYNNLESKNGFGFQSGKIPELGVSVASRRLLGNGTLYFTDTHLHFSGDRGNRNYYYEKLNGGTFYKNGMLLEKKRGKDHFFQFSGDMPAIKLIFDELMTRNREQ